MAIARGSDGSTAVSPVVVATAAPEAGLSPRSTIGAAAPRPSAAVRLPRLDRAVPLLRPRPREPLARGRPAPGRRRPRGADRGGARRRARRAVRRRGRRAPSRICSGLPFELERFWAWARDEPVLAALRGAADGIPAAARSRPVGDARHLDHGPAGLAPFRVRRAVAADRAVRRAATSVAWAFPTRERIAAAGESEIREVGFSGRKAEYVIGLARSDLDLDGLACLPDDEVVAAITGCPRARPLDRRLVPRPLPRPRRRLARRRSRRAQGRLPLLRRGARAHRAGDAGGRRAVRPVAQRHLPHVAGGVAHGRVRRAPPVRSAA